jgi:trehalose 6-phosphate phosphatase
VKYALSAPGLERIGAFVTDRTLLAFDIDGTLAPIVDWPWDARVPHELQEQLGALTQSATVAIITGRAIEDARPMLGFAPRYLVGNHGAEGVPGFEEASAHCARICRTWLDELSTPDEAWREVPGIVLEDKTYSLTFHFRHAGDRGAAHRLLVGRMGRLLPMPTLFDGKFVLNLLPPDAPDKGAALSVLLEQSHCDRALYVGDDSTDEAVFRLRSPNVLSVRVEHDRESAADLNLRGQQDVPRLVRELMRILAVPGAAAPAANRRSSDGRATKPA